MAEILQNNKRYCLIKMTWAEYVATTDTWGMCDCCGKYDANEEYYYVAMVNDFYCKTCFEAWYNSQKYLSPSDYKKERENFNSMTKKMIQKGILSERRF